jgi:hypothetical protein
MLRIRFASSLKHGSSFRQYIGALIIPVVPAFPIVTDFCHFSFPVVLYVRLFWLFFGGHGHCNQKEKLTEHFVAYYESNRLLSLAVTSGKELKF